MRNSQVCMRCQRGAAARPNDRVGLRLLAIRKFAAQFSSCLICVLLAGATAVSAQDSPPSEYEVKAAFLYNFPKFVDWPARRAPVENVLTLCVLGPNPFGKALEVLQDKPVGTVVWRVTFADSKTNLRECPVLFISASDSGNLTQILDSIKGLPVLTVGDTEGYGGRGVVINFYLQDNKVRFEINVEASRLAGLTISSQLLKLARIVPSLGAAR
jgi:hypothetical protein